MEPIRTMLLGITILLIAISILVFIGIIILATQRIGFFVFILLCLSVFLLGAGLRFVWVGYSSDLDEK